MKTYSAKPTDVETAWHIVDAEGLVLGRMAAQVATILRGKHKPMFTPHIDCGDHVIIVNAEKIHMTGNKREQKTYYRHTGYPGGIKSRTAEKILEGAHPERVVEKAIQRMLPRSIMGRTQFKKLKVYAGSEHPHEAQSPAPLDIAGRNSKNTRRA